MIEMKDVMKKYSNGTTAIRNISVEIDQGEFVYVVGPSGAGKSTFIRLMYREEKATKGNLTVAGHDLMKIKNKEVPYLRREIGIVFQDYKLLPKKTVYENVAYAMQVIGRRPREIKKRVMEVLDLVGLKHKVRVFPSELSGGEQQRVSIARAIVNEPKVLLLDEPLSALDLKLRTDMQYELRDLQQRLGITFIFVTHDQEEALAMSDEIFVMNKGKIVQSGTPVDIYDEPINHFVADFVGESNIVDGVMIEDNLVEFVGKQFECVDGGMRLNEPVEVVLRPEDLTITTPDKGKLVVTVDTQLFRGVHYEIICYDEQQNEWMVHSTKKAKEGSKVGLAFEPEDIHVMRFNESEEEFDARLDSYEE